MTKKKTFVSILIILIAIAVTWWYMYHKEPEQVNLNNEIKATFLDFVKFTKENPRVVSNELCSGGFINTGNADLRAIADKIVSNRIIEQDPLTYASSQDEAGITCLASVDTWVLFSALNDNEYYCVDSTGKEGPMSFSRELNQCTR